ncbi:sugar phosphate nucleotidyltransferase [[Clostridium] fimetarium]|uniref:sugar phosphate nucleotidyltransferase n=1 Tax=[Clostridium] fimetarium TaxID=99656 RepID=UPI001FA90F4F
MIIVGGGGKRFWPLSRQKSAKQLLNLGKELMVGRWDMIKLILKMYSSYRWELYMQ